MNRKGFTLIELLIVIAIIGILSSLAIVSLSSARDKAKDAQIKSDLSQFRTYMTVNYPEGVFTDVLPGDEQGTNEMSVVSPALTHPDEDLSYIVLVADGTNTAYDQNRSWAAYGELLNNDVDDNTQYFCVDSSGSAVTISGATPTLPTAPAPVCP